MFYTPRDWYWKKTDGHVWSSAAQAYVAPDDGAYLAWMARGGIATDWPRDDDGIESEAALDAVLAEYGCYIDLKRYAADKRRAVIAGGCVLAVDGLQIPIWADDKTIATLTALVVRASADPNLVIASWRARDGQFFEINAADIATMAEGLFAFIQSAFDIEGAVSADIDAGNITTTDEIDAAEWPSNG